MKRPFIQKQGEATLEERVRKPVKGLRLKLRTALRKAGVKCKFKTAHLRSFAGETTACLCITSTEPFIPPFATFEGITVHYRVEAP